MVSLKRAEEARAPAKRREERPVCEHCGTAFSSSDPEERFCCAGCRFVSGLIRSGGLERFYDLKGDKATSPVKSLVFRERDYGWIREAEAGAGEEGRLDLDVQGIACVGCVWLIESLFARLPGSLRIDINAHLGRIRIWWKPGEFDLEAFARELQRFGYVLGPVREGEEPAAASRELVLRLGLCAAFALNAMGFTLPRYLGMEAGFELARLFELVALLSATFSVFAGGSYFIRRAWEGMKLRVLHIDTPISLGIVFAYSGSIAGWLLGAERLLYFDFVAVFIFLMLLGRWVQEAAVERNRHRLLAGDPRPARVTRRRGDGAEGEGETVEVEAVEAGDVIGVAPGQVTPVSGELFSDAAELSLEWISGEPEARVWKRGGRVPAGAINLGGSEVRLLAAERYRDSMLAKLLAEETGSGPGAGRDRGGDAALQRLLKAYLIVILATGTAGAAAWVIATGDIARALQVAISVFVVSCPCALGIALPMADEMAVKAMRRAGLFVREKSLWRRLSRLRRVVFDKTGTLTTEVPELVNPEELARLDESERKVLAVLAGKSRHPFSRSLREAMARRGEGEKDSADGVEVREVIGSGMEIVDGGGESWRFGRSDWEEDSPGEDRSNDCVFSRGKRVLARFHFEEALRGDAVEEISRLERRGLEISILSGDRVGKVRAVGAALGLPAAQCHGALRPEEKAAWMRRNGASLYIGDGANDSLAFGESDCTGTPAVDAAVLQRKADFFYLGNGLEAIRKLLEMAERRRRAVAIVIGFSLTYNALAAGICLAGWMSPLLAAVLMPASSLVSLFLVVMNIPESEGRGASRKVLADPAIEL